MALIFWFSSMPGNEVARAADPLFKHAPTLKLVKPVQIPWLKVGHFIGYAGLGASMLYVIGPGKRSAVMYTISVTILYAFTDEFHQTFTPGRHAGFNDVLIDVGAACVAILLYEIIRRLRDFRIATNA